MPLMKYSHNKLKPMTDFRKKELKLLIKKHDRPYEVVEDYLKAMNHLSPAIKTKILRDHKQRLAAQAELRKLIRAWCEQYGNGEKYDTLNAFTQAFKVDPLTASSFGKAKADELAIRIRKHVP